jgi:hypothetical protein
MRSAPQAVNPDKQSYGKRAIRTFAAPRSPNENAKYYCAGFVPGDCDGVAGCVEAP